MKKVLIIILLFTVASGASAQYGHNRAHRFYYAPQVIIAGGYSPFYPFYSPYYSPYYRYNNRPTKLDLKIEDIRNDYNENIWAVKHDKSLTHKQRRQEVRRLKHERDNKIMDAKLNYYNRH